MKKLKAGVDPTGITDSNAPLPKHRRKQANKHLVTTKSTAESAAGHKMSISKEKENQISSHVTVVDALALHGQGQ